MTHAPISKVMICDDEPDIRTVAEIAIADVGQLEVVAIESGHYAVETAKRERPDVILLDVMMPEIDGPATLSLLRADPDTCQIPIIFMTAKAQPKEVDGYLEIGATGVIVKPFDPMTLASQITEILSNTEARKVLR